jgi:hypothetical protein
LLQNADPTTQANTTVAGMYTPAPFSAGNTTYATPDSGLQRDYVQSMTGKYLAVGGKKSKPRTTRKAKK